ncbi:MAG: TPM domain-containing protein [Planctomycetota bacterium]|nr:TPM domain-containing protein [Planctomycetota bacterium]
MPRLSHLLLLLLLCSSALAAEVMPPAPTRYFNDYASVVPAADAERINTKLEDLEKASSNQIVVAVYPTMQTESSIEDYTFRVKEKWHVGKKGKDNGAVLFVFVKEHKLWIQTNYGLEASLPDALCKQIVDEEITPRFKAGDFAGGLDAGVNAMIAATKGEYKGTGTTVNQTPSFWVVFRACGFFLIVAIIVGFIMVHSIKQSYRDATVYNSTGRTRRRTSGWGPSISSGGWRGSSGGWGGSSGGGGFSGGGGGGGFTGGGGTGGGGGAGGSW